MVNKNTISFDDLYNGRLRQIFLYITNRCNLKCKHCYMEISETVKSDMSLDEYVVVLEKLISLGATKATFLGGEPTLHPDLSEMLRIAAELDVDYLRLDTNGEFEPTLLEDSHLRRLDDICFSLDGANVETHGRIRSERNYYNVIENIKHAVALGYNVRVTMTLNSENIYEVEQMIAILGKIGVETLNLHLASNSGRVRTNEWLLVEPEVWSREYVRIMQNISRYGINVKIPIRFVSVEDPNFKDIITCESAKYSRLAVGPSLEAYSCPLLIDTGKYFARFSERRFVLSDNYRSNLVSDDIVNGPACPLIYEENPRMYDQKELIPVCVSCKPNWERANKKSDK